MVRRSAMHSSSRSEKIMMPPMRSARSASQSGAHNHIHHARDIDQFASVAMGRPPPPHTHTTAVVAVQSQCRPAIILADILVVFVNVTADSPAK